MTKFQPIPCLVFLVVLTAFTGCNKLLDAGSPRMTNEDVFSNDSLALAATVAIYTGFMSENLNLFNGGTSWLAALSADELAPRYPEADAEFYVNDIDPKNSILRDTLWTTAYKRIYQCNTLVEGLTAPNSISEKVKARVMGEARFLRAFCYYYLTAFFGDVPLVLETDAKKTAFLPRAPVAEVYRQMIADLQAADGLLTNDNSNAFAGKLACEALLARVYLHGEDWSNAEKYSTAVIGSGLLALETDLDRAFLRPSKETIFQLEPVSRPYNAMEGHLFGVPAFDKAPVYDLLPGLAAAFEPGDRRKAHWTKSYTVGAVTYHIPYKYKIYWSGSASNEYNVVLRLAEQYLIRAEARARQGNIAGAVDDLNVIRHRAGLPGLSPNMTSGECLLAIEKERRLELFTEWGHRWFDLRRTGRAHAVLSLVKGPYWDRTDQLYPVPEGEIQLNPHLSQNEGYY